MYTVLYISCPEVYCGLCRRNSGRWLCQPAAIFHEREFLPRQIVAEAKATVIIMSSYRELIKDFEKIRTYMRDFYLYGFKSREEYRQKSARSYDDERRRMESWLGDHMRFTRTKAGKVAYLSVDSRRLPHNPFYKAWKTRSFTDGDITLHFILFDILYHPSVVMTLEQLMRQMDGAYLSLFPGAPTFDSSTLRKKLAEYEREGLIVKEKQGNRMLYRRSMPPEGTGDLLSALTFFSEVAPCGVIGSFLLDKEAVNGFDGSDPGTAPQNGRKREAAADPGKTGGDCEKEEAVFRFKHHYITQALDSDVMERLLLAIRERRYVSFLNLHPRIREPKRQTALPLQIFISVQNGRQYLLAYHPVTKCLCSYRLDYLAKVQAGEPASDFERRKEQVALARRHMWGVNIRRDREGKDRLERVMFEIRILPGEDYVLQRLMREKRIGHVEPAGNGRYRFFADLYDTSEIIPWIRTFVGRLTAIRFSNRTAENQFRQDLAAMERLYEEGRTEETAPGAAQVPPVKPGEGGGL